MIPKSVLALALLPWLMTACDKAAPVDTAKEAAAIEAQLAGLNVDLKAGDAERAISMDAKDFHGFGRGPDIQSREENLKFLKSVVSDPNSAFALKSEHTEVAKSGDVAFQYGSWTGAATDPKTRKAAQSSGSWVAGWRKQPDDGSWRLVAISTAASPATAR